MKTNTTSKIIAATLFAFLGATGCDAGTPDDQEGPSSIETAEEEKLAADLELGLDPEVEPREGAEDRVSDDLDFTAVINPQAFSWLPWISEETAAATCPANHMVTGIDCSGSYCDNVRLECHYYGGSMSTNWWTSFFSEESTSYRVCPANHYVTGLDCSGSYCDNVSLRCSRSTQTTQRNCSWTGWFSEEDPAYLAPIGEGVRGMQCSGSNCDNKRYYACDID